MLSSGGVLAVLGGSCFCVLGLDGKVLVNGTHLVC